MNGKLKKEVADYFGQFSKDWKRGYRRLNTFKGRHRQRTVIKMVLSFAKSKNSRILDVGCGCGDQLEEYIKLGYNAVGVDISETLIREGKKNKVLEKSLFLGDAEKLNFKDNAFDVISVIDVIEHVPDRNKLLSECRRTLKCDGHIIITTPNKFCPWWFFRRAFISLFNLKNIDAPCDKEFSFRELKELVQKNNLHVESIGCFSFIPPFSPAKLSFLFINLEKVIEKIPFFKNTGANICLIATY